MEEYERYRTAQPAGFPNARLAACPLFKGVENQGSYHSADHGSFFPYLSSRAASIYSCYSWGVWRQMDAIKAGGTSFRHIGTCCCLMSSFKPILTGGLVVDSFPSGNAMLGPKTIECAGTDLAYNGANRFGKMTF